MVDQALPLQTSTESALGRAAPSQGAGLFGRDGFDFWDLVDVINPLQHLPIVGPIYRAVTGDELGYAPRVAGGALFGGPIGAGLAVAEVMLQETTGRDAGEHAFALFDQGGSDPSPTLAENDSEPLMEADLELANALAATADISAWAQGEAMFKAEAPAAPSPLAPELAGLPGSNPAVLSSAVLSQTVSPPAVAETPPVNAFAAIAHLRKPVGEEKPALQGSLFAPHRAEPLRPLMSQPPQAAASSAPVDPSIYPRVDAFAALAALEAKSDVGPGLAAAEEEAVETANLSVAEVMRRNLRKYEQAQGLVN